MASDRLEVLLGHVRQSPWKTRVITPFHVSAVGGLPSNSSQESFQFTLDGGKLTYDERKFYEENGYIVIRKLVSDELLDNCRDRFMAYCDGRIPKGFATLMKDISLINSGVTGEFLYYKLQDFIYDEELFRYCTEPAVVDYVESFTGPNIMAIHTMLINKPPDSGKLSSRHPLHQDLHYFPFRPADKIVCSWTAMEKMSAENGCLVVIPGTHLGELLDHKYPEWEGGVNKGYHAAQSIDISERVHLNMEKGDTVFFHPKLIHGSGTNRTQGCRKSISCHYAASECEYIEVAPGTSQEMVAKEIVELALKRTNLTGGLQYQDIWKFRNRLVRGQEINM